jgi:4-amino-4-deoxy-L-arabinose transferase-like glycosyltransferase
VAALTVLAAVIRFYGIGHQGFWFDEANTALLVKFSPGKMLGLIPQTESTPPLYYCVAWVWSRVFGDTEAGLRSLSALAGVLVVPVAYGAGARLVSPRAGVIVAALTACNPFLIWYAQEARAYSLLVLMCGLSLLAFAHARERPTPRTLAAWVIVSVLALLTHYYAVAAVAPEGAWLLWEHRRRRSVQVAIGAAVLCGLALLPLVLEQNSTGRDSWIAHSPLNLRLEQILPQFLIGTNTPLRQPLKFLAFVLAVVAMALVTIRAGAEERRRARLPAAFAAGGFLMALLFVAAGSDTLITRNLIELWLPAALLVAAGMASRHARRLGVLLCAGLCAVGLTGAIAVAAKYSFQRPDWRPVARILGPGPRAGTSRLILIQHYRTLLPLSLYLPRLRFDHGPVAHDVSEIDVISMVSPGQPLCWWGAACNLIPSQMQAGYAVAGFRPVWRRHVHQFTILRLLAARPRPVSERQISRALVTTTLHRDELLIQRP